VTVFRAVVGATILYGSEIWGMNQKRCDPAQPLVNKAMRVMVQCKESGKGVRMAAMWRELNIPPVRAEASARRARALMKYPSLKTWIGVLTRYPFTSRQFLWYDGGLKWMKRFCPSVEMGTPDGDHPMGAEQAYMEVLDAVWQSIEDGNKGAASMSYVSRGYVETMWASTQNIPSTARAEQVQLGRGLRLLHLCRTSSLWTADRMAWQHFEGMEQYQNKCPCCEEEVRETIKHIQLECSKWNQQRQEYMGEVIRAAWSLSRSVMSHPTNERWGCSWWFQSKVVQASMLGGEVDGRRLQYWLPSEESSECGAFRVARFLQSIEAARRALTPHDNPLHKSDAGRVNARKGKAAQAKSLGNKRRSGRKQFVTLLYANELGTAEQHTHPSLPRVAQ